MPQSDQRLERLYDYTKFHIGIYLLAAGAMITIASSAELHGFFSRLTAHRHVLMAAIGAMGLAGVAGGVIARSCACAANWSDVWGSPIGPWHTKILPGSTWARIEHTAFWASAMLFTAAALYPAA